MIKIERFEDHIVERLSVNRDAVWAVHLLIWSDENQDYSVGPTLDENRMEKGEVYWVLSGNRDAYAWVNEDDEPMMLFDYEDAMDERELDVFIHTMLSKGESMETMVEFLRV